MPDALAGKLLVANPGVADPNFAKSVVLVCESGVNGAFGLVLNRPLPRSAAVHLTALVGADLLQGPVSDGGPQERTKLMALGLARRGFSAPWWRALGSCELPV